MSMNENDVSVRKGFKEALAMSWRPILLPLLLALSLVWCLLMLPVTTVIAPIWGFCRGYTAKLSYRDKKDLRTAKWESRLQKILDLVALPVEKMLDI